MAIARALVQEPEILLLDEPTASLDQRARVEILELVAELHRAGNLTTLMVTHDSGTAARVCSRLVFLKAGRIAGQGRPGDLLRKKVIDRALWHIARCRRSDGGYPSFR